MASLIVFPPDYKYHNSRKLENVEKIKIKKITFNPFTQKLLSPSILMDFLLVFNQCHIIYIVL